MSTKENNTSDWLLKLLKEIQLDQFYIKLRDDLQVTRLSHFDYVKPEDLEGIGMGRPAIRRLLDCVKKHQGRKSFLTKILPVKQSVTTPQQQPTSPVMLMSSMMSSNSDALKCLINEKDLHFVCKLGDGSFGVVRKAIWMTSPVNKIPVAVKTLKGEMDGSMEEFMDEVRTMYSLDHPNIIHLYGVVLSNPLMMVTELAPLGSLLTYLRHPDHHCRNLPLLTTLHSYMLQICDGLVYLQSLHLIHRDLAARNIFMMSLERVKIGDFGLMRSLSSHGDHYVMSEKKKMPFAWCAPESLKLRHFSHASDCWMVGVVMWEIFSGGEEPWVGLNGGEILQRIDSPNDRLVRPRRCPSRFYEHILKKCWACRPSDRPDFKTLKSLLIENTPEEYVSLARYNNNSSGRADGDDNDRNNGRIANPLAANDDDNDVGGDDNDVVDGGGGFLDLEKDDLVIIIDGRPTHHWWFGQNKRTTQIGMFPRTLVDPMRKISGDDISSPLKNSLVHAGHADGGGGMWGNPSFIDEKYLKNPTLPPDIRCRSEVISRSFYQPKRGSTNNIRRPTRAKSPNPSSSSSSSVAAVKNKKPTKDRPGSLFYPLPGEIGDFGVCHSPQQPLHPFNNDNNNDISGAVVTEGLLVDIDSNSIKNNNNINNNNHINKTAPPGNINNNKNIINNNKANRNNGRKKSKKKLIANNIIVIHNSVNNNNLFCSSSSNFTNIPNKIDVMEMFDGSIDGTPLPPPITDSIASTQRLSGDNYTAYLIPNCTHNNNNNNNNNKNNNNNTLGGFVDATYCNGRKVTEQQQQQQQQHEQGCQNVDSCTIDYTKFRNLFIASPTSPSPLSSSSSAAAVAAKSSSSPRHALMSSQQQQQHVTEVTSTPTTAATLASSPQPIFHRKDLKLQLEKQLHQRSQQQSQQQTTTPAKQFSLTQRQQQHYQQLHQDIYCNTSEYTTTTTTSTPSGTTTSTTTTDIYANYDDFMLQEIKHRNNSPDAGEEEVGDDDDDEDVYQNGDEVVTMTSFSTDHPVSNKNDVDANKRLKVANKRLKIEKGDKKVGNNETYANFNDFMLQKSHQPTTSKSKLVFNNNNSNNNNNIDIQIDNNTDAVHSSNNKMNSSNSILLPQRNKTILQPQHQSQHKLATPTTPTSTTTSTFHNINHINKITFPQQLPKFTNNNNNHNDVRAQMIKALMSEVAGSTWEESEEALEASDWSKEKAGRRLKLNKLCKLGIASESRCLMLLQKYCWDFKMAVSMMLHDENITSSV